MLPNNHLTPTSKTPSRSSSPLACSPQRSCQLNDSPRERVNSSITHPRLLASIGSVPLRACSTLARQSRTSRSLRFEGSLPEVSTSPFVFVHIMRRREPRADMRQTTLAATASVLGARLHERASPSHYIDASQQLISLCYCLGVPLEPPHLRSLTYSLLLGTLPKRRAAWPTEQDAARRRYHDLSATFLGQVERAPVS